MGPSNTSPLRQHMGLVGEVNLWRNWRASHPNTWGFSYSISSSFWLCDFSGQAMQCKSCFVNKHLCDAEKTNGELGIQLEHGEARRQ